MPTGTHTERGAGGAGAQFAGPGEMRAQCRAFDWAGSPLGPVDSWPAALRTAVDICLGSAFASFVWWGPELIQLYNDAALAMVRAKHPHAFAIPARQAWPDVWEEVGPLAERVLASGEPVRGEDMPLVPDRGGPREVAYFTFSYGAIRDESGTTAGMFITAIETTHNQQAVSDRLNEANENAARAQERERESDTRYRTLFESIDEGFCIIERIETAPGEPPDFRYLETNPAFERHAGLTGVVGRTIREVVPEAEVEVLTLYDRVATTGEPMRFEARVAVLDLWIEVHVSRVDAPEHGRIAVVFSNITERKRAEAALRTSEERQSFMLSLSDALRALADPVEIQGEAARLIGERLGADRVLYADTEGDTIVVHRDWVRGIASMAGRYPASEWGEYIAVYLRGEPYVVHDVACDPKVDDTAVASYRSVDVAAFIGMGLVKEGAHVASFGVHSRTPRAWTADEIELVRETADRTWEAVERARAETALRESETRLGAVFETLPVGVGVVDVKGTLVLSNQEMRRYLPTGVIPSRDPSRQGRWRGWNPDGDLVEPPDFPAARALRGESVLPGLEMLYTQDDGHELWTRVTGVPIRDGQSRVGGAAVIVTDIDTLKRTSEALRSNETRYRTLIENVQDYAIFLLDVEGVVTEWTSGAERVKGYTSDEAVGRHLSLFYTPEAVAAGEPDRELAEATATGRAEREGWRVRKGGERFWVNEIATAIHDRDGQLMGFTKIARDLTERRAAEAAVERTRAASERDELRRQLMQAEEDERRRLSRELHDEAGQHLTALGLGLQALSDIAAAGSEVDRRATQLRELANTLGQELHAIAVRLRPRALDDFGLEAALTAYAEDWSRQSGIHVDVHTRPAAVRLPSATESAIYRVVQEALTNIARHSGATRASIVLERHDGRVVAVVEDDGHGFDPTNEVRAADAAALGLLGVRERVELLGGTVAVESSPGAGTSLFVRIPIVATSNGSHDHD